MEASQQAGGEMQGNTVGKRERGRRRERSEELAVLEAREPLRRRILAVLADGPLVSSAIAEEIEARRESVSRKLTELHEEGLVRRASGGLDRRRRTYSITPQGELELSEHRAFLAPDPVPAAVATDEANAYLCSALQRAVALRRSSNRRSEAIERLNVVREEAEAAGSEAVALEALVELATTYRQDRQLHPLEHVLKRMEEIARGSAGLGADLAVPAAAHLEYTMGRLGDLKGEDHITRANHLIAAVSLYGQLVQKAEAPVATQWTSRRAWSVISLSVNLRKQSKLDEALSIAVAALKLFDELEDPYGRSFCFFSFGFCLRLLGRFDVSWTCLNHAHDLAKENGFERFRADALMQMGEVRRCQGHVEEAREILTEALAQASGLGLLVTEAFAQSSLGAAEHQRQEFAAAETALERAQGLFEASEHHEGLALNERRRAAVAQRLMPNPSRGDARGIERLIRRAKERYTHLRSPAGIVACEIEEGRLRLKRDAKGLKSVLETLQAMYLSDHQRKYVELDPWVPLVFEDFAEELGDEDMKMRSAAIREGAAKRLEEGEDPEIQLLAAEFGQLERADAERSALGDEMGGEARRDLGHDLSVAFA
jgi:DNA-binding MarR family transcriptional regulator